MKVDRIKNDPNYCDGERNGYIEGNFWHFHFNILYININNNCLVDTPIQVSQYRHDVMLLLRHIKKYRDAYESRDVI